MPEQKPKLTRLETLLRKKAEQERIMSAKINVEKAKERKKEAARHNRTLMLLGKLVEESGLHDLDHIILFGALLDIATQAGNQSIQVKWHTLGKNNEARYNAIVEPRKFQPTPHSDGNPNIEETSGTDTNIIKGEDLIEEETLIEDNEEEEKYHGLDEDEDGEETEPAFVEALTSDGTHGEKKRGFFSR